jgi:hypothetical protein
MSSSGQNASASATALVPAPASASASGPIPTTGTEIPSEKTLAHAARIAVEQDKPIMLDYFNDTKNGKAFLGEDPDTKERILVKSAEEYTSPIQKIFKANTDFIVLTENSIYVVSCAIKKKVITTGGNSMPASSGGASRTA